MVYPKNEMVEKLLVEAVDEETGEMLLTEEELAAKMEEIDITFDEKIKALRNSYLSDKVDVECIKAEASALWKLQQEASKRATAIENRMERTKRFLAWLLNGEKYNKDGVKVSYITRETAVTEEGFVDWAKTYAPGFLNEPTIRKKDVEQALKAGSNLGFAHMETKKYIQVR